MPYSPPATAQPFTLDISDQEISEWRQLLQLSRLGPTTYEGAQEDRRFGVTTKWLSDAKDYWLNKYDWRAQEKHINSFPNYTMKIDEIDIHFIALFSEKEDAIPIVLMHGWPGSFIEFLPMLKLVREKYSANNLPFHLIVPSLPGYTLSSGPPVDKDWLLEDSARIIHKLVLKLGFEKYVAQGGDIGSFEARILAQEYDACVAIHLNMFASADQPDQNSLSALEKAAHSRLLKFQGTGSAYGMEHSSRPGTIGHVLSSSPLALLAWIGEKFLEWSDEDPSLDTILTNISLYWFTGGFPRSIYPYRQLFDRNRTKFEYIKKPTGFSFFPHEQIPGFRSVLEKNTNLVFYKQHQRGGHFAALERPKEFLEDVEEFIGKAWKV